MSLLGSALRSLRSTVSCLAPHLKPQVLINQPSCKSPTVCRSETNFHSLPLRSYPVIQLQRTTQLPLASFHTSPSMQITLEYMHRKGLYKKERKKKKSPLDGRPQIRGVVLKTLIKKPKKPNSANRKCVRLRLTNGKEVTAYVPGEGHNLQEHNIVLVQGGKLQDTPGVKLVCVRGKYDLTHVKKK